MNTTQPTPTTPADTTTICRQLGKDSRHTDCGSPLLDARTATIVVSSITTAAQFALWIEATKGWQRYDGPTAQDLEAALAQLATFDPQEAERQRALGHRTTRTWDDPEPLQHPIERWYDGQAPHLMRCGGQG
jgi:membrane-bound lytic murein transglycosylase B